MNSNIIYSIALALLLGVTPAALAGNGNGPSGGDGSCTGNCPQDGTGGTQEQTQTQTMESNNANTNTNTSNSTSQSDAESASNSDSSSNSSSDSYSSGGSVRSDIVASGGQSESSSEASVGDVTGTGGVADARVGDTSATSDVGDITSESGSNSNDISYSTSYEAKASSAATVFAGHCQSGGSAQMDAGGFSVVNPEAYCNHIRMAAVAREAYEYEMSKCVCVGVCTIEEASVSQECSTATDKAQGYLDMYHDNLNDANGLLQATTVVGKVDAFAGYLIRPLAVLALLILL